jgi:hypothetical protein
METQTRRRALAIICFIFAVSLPASVFIFIDSNSYQTWEQCIDIGSVAMKVFGDNLESKINQIANISYVTKACLVKTAEATIRMDKYDIYFGSPNDPNNPMFLLQGNAYSLSEDFINNFPQEFEIVEGRYPQNSSEIAIPLTFAAAAGWNIPIGRMMNYSHTLNGPKRTVFVVGFCRLSLEDPMRAVATNAVAIVTPEVLNPTYTREEVYMDIDRQIITPVDPRGSLNLLYQIEGRVKAIANSGSPLFNVDNYFARGIETYNDFISLERSRQVTRLQTILLLSGLFSFLAVRYIMIYEEDFTNFKRMRGASRINIIGSNMIELWILSLVALIPSIFIASFLSEIGELSTDYLRFNMALMQNETLIISTDSLIIVGLASFILPVIGLIAHKLVRGSSRRDMERGRLARITRVFQLAKWDIFIYVLIGVFSIGMFLSAQSISQNPVLLLAAIFIPVPLFFAAAGLFSKGASLITRVSSKILHPTVRKVPALVGIRSFSNNDRLSILTVFILALVLSSTLSNEITSTSLVQTHLDQTRYLIGGDISLKLDGIEGHQWDNLSKSLLQQDDVRAVSYVSIGSLSLSEGTSGTFELVAIDPEQYSHIGYTYLGESIDESYQKSLLESLETNPEGAILTNDIALEYDLTVGDTLRVFSFGDNPMTAEFSIMGLADAITRPSLIVGTTSDEVIGTSRIWLNRNYVSGLVDLNTTTETYLCARTEIGTNTTLVLEDILRNYNFVVLGVNQWSAITSEMKSFQMKADFVSDRAIDSMLSIGMICSIFAVFFVYEIRELYESRGEYALLKLMGLSRKSILKIKLAGALNVIFLSFLLIVLFCPWYILNSLGLEFLEYNSWGYNFPVAIMIQIDWSGLLGLIVCSLLPSILLMMALFVGSRESSIAIVLREIENGRKLIYGGDHE